MLKFSTWNNDKGQELMIVSKLPRSLNGGTHSRRGSLSRRGTKGIVIFKLTPLDVSLLSYLKSYIILQIYPYCKCKSNFVCLDV